MRLTDSLKQLGRSVGKCKRSSMPYQIMKDSRLVKLLVPKIGLKLRNELVSSIYKSELMFRNSSISSICSFDWTVLSENLKQTNPLLSALLKECTNANRSAVRKPSQNIIVCVIAGILLRNCSQQVNLLQSIFSLIFYASHVPNFMYHNVKLLFYRCIHVYRRLPYAYLIRVPYHWLISWDRIMMRL